MCLVSGGRQASCRGKRPEEAFELVVGEAEGVFVEDVTQETDSRLAGMVVEGTAE
jgi:hypothetical protein